jgi:hypothetical protein
MCSRYKEGKILFIAGRSAVSVTATWRAFQMGWNKACLRSLGSYLYSAV